MTATGTNFQQKYSNPRPPPTKKKTNLQATNILSWPAHISGAQQEAEFADHHSLDDYLGNIFQKSSCDSKNIFFPPLPMTFKVVLLLPAAPDGRHKLCSHLRWFVLALAHAHAHARNGGYRQAQNLGVALILVHDYVVLPPTVRKWNCVNNRQLFFIFSCFGTGDVNRPIFTTNPICSHLLGLIVWGNQTFLKNRKPAFIYIIKAIVKFISSLQQMSGLIRNKGLYLFVLINSTFA